MTRLHTRDMVQFFWSEAFFFVFEIFIDSYVVKKKCKMYGEFPFTPFPHLSLEKGIATTPYSHLENPIDRGVWWAIVHGVAKSQTRLKQLSLHACTSLPPNANITQNCNIKTRKWTLAQFIQHIQQLYRHFSVCGGGGVQCNFFTSVAFHMPKPLTVWITINCGRF